MITFHEDTCTFHFGLAHSYYAFFIDDEDRAVHLGWGVRPPTAASSLSLDGKTAVFHLLPASAPTSGFTFQTRPDEILTFGDITIHDVTLKASFATDSLPLRDLRLRYHSHDIVTDGLPALAPTHGLPVQNETPRQTLRLHLRDQTEPFRVTLCYRLTPEHDILERWLELHNDGDQPIEIDICRFASLHLPNGTTELTSISGAWAREFATQREVVSVGSKAIEGRSLQTGHDSNPIFMLNRPRQAWEESGTVYFGQLGSSGHWQLLVEHLQTGQVRLHGGYHTADFALTLPPNESHVTPALLCGVCPDGWGGASRRMHAFTRERVLPRPQRENPLRPVLYNSWEATYFDLSLAGQIALAQKAAAMGVELFCLDDGWFGGRRHDAAGLGDWTVSPDVFPDGLEPLVAEVQRLGMQFGLWVEPEMINANSELYRAHPDWVLHFPNRPRTEARNQLILDFGRSEVVEHIFNALDTLVRRYGIDFFKWDMNRSVSEPGSVVGQRIWRQHTTAVYDIMDRLRKNHPTLDIQSCSGGGGRIDLGIMGRTDQVWTSDNTDALDRIRIQEGFSLAYPARAMEAWVTHETNHITKRTLPLSLRFDVAMRGALGIGSSLNELSQTELGKYASYIAFYKRFRHVVQEGELYRLQRLEEADVSIVQYVLPDGSEAVHSVTVRDWGNGRYPPPAPLKALIPTATYTAHNWQGQIVLQASGYELMTLGIPLGNAHPGYSQTLHLKRVE